MQGYNVDERTTRVRWLVFGTFSATTTPRCVQLNRNNFAERLSQAKLEVTVAVPDRFGADDSRRYTLRFGDLKDFKLKSVATAVPELRSLSELAAQIGKAGGPEPDALLDKVVAQFGQGRLAAQIVALLREEKAPEPAPVAKVEGAATDDPIEAIFAQTKVTTLTDEAKGAVDAFVASMRGNKAAVKIPSKALRDARNLIEDLVYATARDILIDSNVHRFEGAWRGLKLVVDQTPPQGDVDVVLLDVPPGTGTEAIDAILPDDVFDYPDAVFFTDPVDDADALRTLADYFEGLNVVGVVATSQALYGKGPAFAEAARYEDEIKAALGDAWQGLRGSESSRWLAVVQNRAVVNAEGLGQSKRVVLTSPALYAAALLSQSYKATGAFGNIIGNPGGLSAPAVWNVPGDEETVLPLEAFVSIRAQTVLASNGIIAFGSGKNSDRVVLSHTPTLRDSQSAVPLAAQIHTGKIVRFAVWVSDQITRQSTHEEIRKIYEEAAGVFLFGHLPPKMAELTAQLWPEENNPKIRVSAQMAPQLLGTHLVVVFNLPIRA